MKKRNTLALSVSAATLGLVAILLWIHQESNLGKDDISPVAASKPRGEIGFRHGAGDPLMHPTRFGIVESPIGESTPPGYAEHLAPSSTDLDHIHTIRAESVALTESLRSTGMSEDLISAMQQQAEDHIKQLMQPEAPGTQVVALDPGMLRSNLSDSLKGAGYSQEAIEAMTAAMIPDNKPLPPPPEAESR